MGREVKRVALDFEWPTDVVWKGYRNPYSSTECSQCDGSGLNPETRKIDNDWYTHLRTDGKEGWQRDITQDEVQALVDAGRLMDFTRTPRNDEQRDIVKKKLADGFNSWLPEDNGYIPSASEVNEWSRSGFGHDSINRWICVEARAKRLGVYGHCSLCDGKGHYWCDDKYEALSEDWTFIEPPKGDGYQIWETVSEGSPISPVYETPEQLASHMAETRWGADEGTSYENWLKFIRGPGWAPSMIMSGGVMKTGVEAVV